MNYSRNAIIIGLLLLISVAQAGCVSTKSVDVFVSEKISGPKVIAMSGVRAPWVFEIEKRLRARGFEVKRWASQNRAIEQVSPNKLEAYNEASAQVILRIDGFAPNTSMTRCFGGGYKFNYITVEAIDVAKNETLAAFSNSGYSENCPPLSGTIFGDIAGMVDGLFK